MRIAIAQINSQLGAFQANSEKILDFSKRAESKRAHVVIFPEMSLMGYPALDLLEREYWVKEQAASLKALVKKLPKKITVIFGAVIENPELSKVGGKPFLNCAVIVHGGKVQYAAKQLLPSYDVFDETRFFEPGDKTKIFNIKNIGQTAVTVCEDMWADYESAGSTVYSKKPFKGLKSLKLLINISASPFSKRKHEARISCAKALVKKSKAPFVYVNLVGGQDELIFDGRSFVLDENGKLLLEATSCAEDLAIIDLKSKLTEYRPEPESRDELLRQVLVLGIRDFVKKSGLEKVHLGLSGGIDSAVVAALAVDALGPQRVVGFLLPGPYSSEGSVSDSELLAKNLSIKTVSININESVDSVKNAVNLLKSVGVEENKLTSGSIVEQNIQARLRGVVLMAYSNASGSMLLTTGNKSEIATGYCTLYGDMCGGLAPIGDLLKEEVYSLAKLYNQHRELIPQVIIDKAPSAELAPNQKDQDTLPTYDVLDKAVEQIVELRKDPNSKVEKWLEIAIKKSEFKRWQSPPILRVSAHAFGRGRRMPIAQI